MKQMTFQEQLKQFVEANPKLVKKRQTSKEGLYVLKYSKKVFYDNLWNDFLEECRGAVIDDNYNLVSYPFTKIYNYGVESKAPVLASGTVVTAYRKVNGFMVAMTWHDGKILISTTGSLDSPFVSYAEEFVTPQMKDYLKEYSEFTFMFECCHRDDPHIVKEVEGLYLLGARIKEFGSPICHAPHFIKAAANKMGVFYPEHEVLTIDELQTLVRGVSHEGFVFYTEDDVSAKIKSKHYLTKKFLMRGRWDKIMAPESKQSMDEEFYPLIEHIKLNSEMFQALDEQGKATFVENYFATI